VNCGIERGAECSVFQPKNWKLAGLFAPSLSLYFEINCKRSKNPINDVIIEFFQYASTFFFFS